MTSSTTTLVISEAISEKELSESARRKTRFRHVAIGTGGVLLLTLVTAGVAVPLWYFSPVATSAVSPGSSAAPPTPSAKESNVTWPPPRPDPMASYRTAAVSSDAEICSQIGRNVLKKSGTAVDAAIATILCVGVVQPHSTGIGGGSFMTFYDRGKNDVYVYDFREAAPLASNETMYEHNATLSTYGGLAVAVPGEIAGYRLAWERHGFLPWEELFAPTIELCERGITMSRAAASALRSRQTLLNLDAPFREEFFDANGAPLAQNATVYRRRLAKTLRAIAADPYAFYNGSLAQSIVDDIQENGGIVTLEDLRLYKVKERQPIVVRLPRAGVRLVAPPPPSSGTVLALIMGIVDGYAMTASDFSLAVKDINTTTLTMHRIIEAFKFSYAKRSQLGDSDYVNVTELVANMTSLDFAARLRQKIFDNTTHNVSYYEPSFYNRTGDGTSHLSVVDAQGSAVSMTSTINLVFGAKFMGNRTGIIFNNEMDDFSSPFQDNSFGIPPSVSNFIRPGKRPMSSMCPTIALADSGSVRLVAGASGGSRISTATATVAINHLYFGMTPKEAIDLPRMHHQLEPNHILTESGVPEDYRRGLIAKGHKIVSESNQQIAVTNAIWRSPEGLLLAYADPRKGGGTAGI